MVWRQIRALRDNGRLLAQLDHNATHDPLTGLANRVLFQRRLQQALADGPVSVVLIDLDDFKEVNDTLGHEVGDLLLVELAKRLAACAQDGDTVARLGGDEFVLVLPGRHHVEADLAVRAIVEALQQPVAAGRHLLTVGASLGVAAGVPGDEAGVLLRQADIAMYAAKALPGTGAVHHHDELTASHAEGAGLVPELRDAIGREELFLLYQPIVDLADGRVTGAEALVRWAHPTRGVLTPDQFLPLAERGDAIVALGRWVIRTALRQLAEWPELTLNLNLSVPELREPDLVSEVARLLAQQGLDPGRISFEIVESAALTDARAIATVQDLRALGIRVALDDFGTGFSSLSLLQACPVDELKLDRSFTWTAADGTATVAAAVIVLARTLGLHAVAEGVETPEQAARLRELGYPAAQGYHFGRPVPPQDFIRPGRVVSTLER